MTIGSCVAWVVKGAPYVVQAVQFILIVLIARRLLGRGRNNCQSVPGELRVKPADRGDAKSERDDGESQGPERPESADKPDQDTHDTEISETAPEPAQPDGPVRTKFVVDALFLADSFRYVCGAGLDEVFHYVTGVELDGTFVLTRIVPVAFSEQSSGGVRVEDGSNIRTLERLDGWGLPLLAHFHSHPGVGMSATTPSGKDRRFVGRLARGGHIAVGAIFSRDGFVRFYAHDSVPFSVEVKGHHVEGVGEDVFKVDVAERRIPVAVYPSGRARRAWGR